MSNPKRVNVRRGTRGIIRLTIRAYKQIVISMLVLVLIEFGMVGCEATKRKIAYKAAYKTVGGGGSSDRGQAPQAVVQPNQGDAANEVRPEDHVWEGTNNLSGPVDEYAKQRAHIATLTRPDLQLPPARCKLEEMAAMIKVLPRQLPFGQVNPVKIATRQSKHTRSSRRRLLQSGDNNEGAQAIIGERVEHYSPPTAKANDDDNAGADNGPDFKGALANALQVLRNKIAGEDDGGIDDMDVDSLLVGGEGQNGAAAYPGPEAPEADGSVEADEIPFTEAELLDGRNPLVWSPGNDSIVYQLPRKNRCGFRPFVPYAQTPAAYLDKGNSRPASREVQMSLHNRNVLLIGDSIVRNQFNALVAHICNPFLMFNCSHKNMHLFNVDAEYPHSTDFINGPLQCYLNGSEVSSFLPGGTAYQKEANDNSPLLPIQLDPSTSPVANQCKKKLRIRDYHVPGVTHGKTVFTKAEKRKEWHKAFPPPMSAVTFLDTNTTFIMIGCHCHKRSNIGAVLGNLAAHKDKWPSEWGGHIDLVFANGGLHCAKKGLVHFYNGIGEGIRALRSVTSTYDGRPTEMIYLKKPTSFLYRPSSHRQVDEPFMNSHTAVIERVVEEIEAHMLISDVFTKEHCRYHDHLHPSAVCAVTISSAMFEAMRYVFAHRSIVGTTSGKPREPSIGSDDEVPPIMFIKHGTNTSSGAKRYTSEVITHLPWLLAGCMLLIGVVVYVTRL